MRLGTVFVLLACAGCFVGGFLLSSIRDSEGGDPADDRRVRAVGAGQPAIELAESAGAIEVSWAPDLANRIRSAGLVKDLAQLIREIWGAAPEAERDGWVMFAVARWKALDPEMRGWAKFSLELEESEPDFLGWRERGMEVTVEVPKAESGTSKLAERIGESGAAGVDSNDRPEDVGRLLAQKFLGDTAEIDAWLAPGRLVKNRSWDVDPEALVAGAYAAEWAKADLPAALEWLGGLNAAWQGAARAVLLEEIGRDDPLQAVRLLEGLDAKSASAAEAVVVEALARQDLRAALDWLGAREILPGREGVRDRLESFRRLTPVLAELPLGEVIAIYDRFFPGAENQLQKRIYSDGKVEFYRGDSPFPAEDFVALHPGREIELGKELLALPPSAARDQLIAVAMDLWAKVDPAGASDTVLALDGESFERVATALAHPLGNQEPARGLEIASRLSGDSQAGFLQVLAEMSVLGDAARAAEGVAALAQDGAGFKSRATAAFAAAWSRDDLLSASEWLRDLPEGTSRDAGIGSMVSELAPLEPDAAFEWAQSITDGDRRLGALTEAAAQWNALAPEAAAGAIAAADLSADERAAATAARLAEKKPSEVNSF